MLQKVNRIKSRKDFEEIKMRGVMHHSPFFGLVILNSKKTGDSTKKFGYIVSKKISKRAVDRNKIKRLLSESVKKNLSKFQEGSKCVFLVKRQMLNKKFEEVNQVLEELIEKIK